MNATKNIDREMCLRQTITSVIVSQTGMIESLASTLATHIVEGLIRDHSGRYIHVPKSVKPTREEIEARNANIIAEYNGSNREELMRKHGVSRTQFYRVISEYQRARRESRKMVDLRAAAAAMSGGRRDE